MSAEGGRWKEKFTDSMKRVFEVNLVYLHQVNGKVLSECFHFVRCFSQQQQQPAFAQCEQTAAATAAAASTDPADERAGPSVSRALLPRRARILAGRAQTRATLPRVRSTSQGKFQLWHAAR